MKTEKKSSTMADIRLITLLTLATTLAITFYSCNKTKDSRKASSEISTPAPPSSESNPVYVEVDKMPVFPDGDQALLNFIGANTKYPEEAKKNNITGKVIVRFVVEKNGTVSNVEILQKVDPLLDAEAIRVVSSLPVFESPAIKAGEPVRVFYMLPITFALK